MATALGSAGCNSADTSGSKGNFSLTGNCGPNPDAGKVTNVTSLNWANGAPYASTALGTFSPDAKTHFATTGMETDFSPDQCSTVKVISNTADSPATSGVGAYGDLTQPPLFGIAKAYFAPLGIFLGTGWPIGAPQIWALGSNPSEAKTSLIGVPGLFWYAGWFPPFNAYPILAVTTDTMGGICGYQLDSTQNGNCLVSWQPDNPQNGTVTGGANSTAFDNTWTGVVYVQSPSCRFFSALNGKPMSVRIHN